MSEYQKVDVVVEEKVNTYKDIALQIHGKPEVSNYEFFACETLSQQLKAEGFEIRTDVAGHRTGFTASYKSSKPGIVVVFLAEYDALQGIGHACGHNLFGSISALAAVAYKAYIGEVGGEVRVYGTPGEEGGENGSSKGSFVREGFFDDVDIALALHPSSDNGRTGKSLAVAPVDIEFFGKSAHASGQPEKGINALDSVIQVFNGVNALRQHVTDDVRIHGIITNGGEAPNVVPDYASARFYLRAKSRPALDELYTKFENIVKGAALQTGATYKFGLFQNSVDNVVPTPRFDDLFEAYLNTYGETIPDTPKKGAGSTDAGNVSQVVPTLHPQIRISDVPVAGHSIEFREAAKSELGLRSIDIGSRVLAKTALHLAEHPEELKAVKSQHHENVLHQ
ncbi:M20 family metallopeptidase [Peptoniphilus equinus]|uniref:Peptidase M20 domain-containing protein 2 n=1 Tax=Peptoniphilus equinus TaxID=3016343 RepID=A0ABY7QT16_9FIRM|nr:M20 family metallopeptidase [Peptoniphilus equinus]WBW49914.1 M20 family metallopeptidase [Peptoniphilus equinus]